MSQPQLTKAWVISPNIRNTFVSLNDTAAWWIYQNHIFLLARGWTVKFTCNGTTGPTGPSDTTNRLTSQSTCSTRGAAAANAQSYTVLQNVDGLQLMFAYQGATDDIIRVSYSPGGLYTLATPSTNQPTATDEVLLNTATSVVSASTPGDRVMTIWGTTDTRHWSNALFRQTAIVQIFGVEPVVSMCDVGVFTLPYVGYRYLSGARQNATATPTPDWSVAATAVGTAGWGGTVARVFTAAASRLTRLGAGDLDLSGAADGFTRTTSLPTTASDFPALQGGLGAALLPILWQGEKTTNLDGFLGYPIDWWMAYTSNVAVPAVGQFIPGFEPGDNPLTDPLRSNWFVSLGSAMVRPWRNAAAILVTT